jgi:hypothetical protein
VKRCAATVIGLHWFGPFLKKHLHRLLMSEIHRPAEAAYAPNRRCHISSALEEAAHRLRVPFACRQVEREVVELIAYARVGAPG